MALYNVTKKEIIDNIRNLYISFFENGNDYVLRKINEQINIAKYENIELPSLDSIEQDAIIIMANRIFAEHIKQVNSHNSNLQVIRRLRDAAKKYEMLEQLSNILHGNSSEFNLETAEYIDPINGEWCEACIDDYLNNNRKDERNIVETRYVRTKHSIERKPDTCSLEMLKKNELKILVEGLKVVISKIKNNDFNRLNPKIVSEVKRLGVDELENYLNSLKTNNSYINEFINKLKKDNYNSNNEHYGSYCTDYCFKSDDRDNDGLVYRIYLNIPLTEDSVNFITDYCIECQKHLMDFDMKAFFNNKKESQDRTVLYSTYGDMNKKLTILKKLLVKYPNLGLGTPPPSCIRIKGMEALGISHYGVCRYNSMYNKVVKGLPYNSYINSLFVKALIDTLVYYGYDIKNMSDLKLKETKNIVADMYSSSKRSEFIEKVCEFMHRRHNKENGYDEFDNKNVALDTWFVDLMRKNWKTSKTDSSRFSI